MLCKPEEIRIYGNSLNCQLQVNWHLLYWINLTYVSICGETGVSALLIINCRLALAC